MISNKQFISDAKINELEIPKPTLYVVHFTVYRCGVISHSSHLTTPSATYVYCSETKVSRAHNFIVRHVPFVKYSCVNYS